MKYARSITDLAKELGYSREHIAAYYTTRDGFPEKGKQGWDVAAVRVYIENEKRKRADKMKGPDVDLKRKKLHLECDLLRQKIDTEAGKYIAVDDVKELLRNFVSITLGVLGQFRQHVEAITRDAELLKKATALENDLRAKLGDKLEADLDR